MNDIIAAEQLRTFIERVERIEEEIKTLNEDKSEIYKEARGSGFDVKTIRKVVAKRKLDVSDREEQDALFDLYWSALYGSVHVHTPARVEKIEEFGSQPVATVHGSDANTANGLAGPACAQDAAAANTKPAPISDDDVPAFLKKDRYVLRPHCLNPSVCAGTGKNHCHACLKARGEANASAEEAA